MQLFVFSGAACALREQRLSNLLSLGGSRGVVKSHGLFFFLRVCCGEVEYHHQLHLGCSGGQLVCYLLSRWGA